MKRGLGIALVVAGCLMTAPGVLAQMQGSGQAGSSSAGQSNAKGNEQKPANGAPQSSSNPFPDDTSTVPVMPSKGTPDVPPDTFDESESDRISLPSHDLDPVKSPDGIDEAGSEPSAMESSSDVRSLDSLLPKPGDDDTDKRGKKGRGVIEDAPKETSKEDISVGKYYLDNKNWRAAQSRFQSALVLAPEDPEVYWGLAESARHLGNFADARTNYEKVIEYDPDSRHAKEAQKALKDPEIANAKAAPAGQTAPQ
ncbi:MAG: tetratricopeptide repeat protein [Terracidiphilus sp.]|nr:tetratricopeptide repeat protein [Terracidiphilus sp.]